MHVAVVGKGRRRRPVLLDDSTLVALLRRYLEARGCRPGSLFRAKKNYAGGPLRYASVQQHGAAPQNHRALEQLILVLIGLLSR